MGLWGCSCGTSDDATRSVQQRHQAGSCSISCIAVVRDDCGCVVDISSSKVAEGENLEGWDLSVPPN